MSTPMYEAEVRKRVFVLSDPTRRAVVQWVPRTLPLNCIFTHSLSPEELRAYAFRRRTAGVERSPECGGTQSKSPVAKPAGGTGRSSCHPQRKRPFRVVLPEVSSRGQTCIFKKKSSKKKKNSRMFQKSNAVCCEVFHSVPLFCLSWQCVKANQVTGPALGRQLWVRKPDNRRSQRSSITQSPQSPPSKELTETSVLCVTLGQQSPHFFFQHHRRSAHGTRSWSRPPCCKQKDASYV